MTIGAGGADLAAFYKCFHCNYMFIVKSLVKASVFFDKLLNGAEKQIYTIVHNNFTF